MYFGLVNGTILFGLLAIGIPVLIHFLNRRRYDVVDWGAMQFLEISETRRRRLLIEELLLMLLRMALIAVMVLALAAPFAAGPLIAQLGKRPPRDVVLIVDGSYSMQLDDGTNPSPQTATKEWARRFLRQLSPEDRVAILQAKRQLAGVVGNLTGDLEYAATQIDRLPLADGNCHGPPAVARALEILHTQSEREERDIIILTDGQRYGWADQAALSEWAKVANWYAPRHGKKGMQPPRLWYVNVRNDTPAKMRLHNYALAELRPMSYQVWAGQKISVKTKLAWFGDKPSPEKIRLRLEADGKFVRYVPFPSAKEQPGNTIPLEFFCTFSEPGTHTVSLSVEPVSPKVGDAKHAPSAPLDCLAQDNRSELTLTVRQTLPVLVVDGDEKLSAESSSFFLRRTFTDASDNNPSARILAKTVLFRSFTPALLEEPYISNRPDTLPRVMILVDVPHFNEEQQNAIERFLRQGGSVLVAVGKRVKNADFYNEKLFCLGKGWLPAELAAPAGNAEKPELAASPDVREFHHPALEIFQKRSDCTLESAKFPRWWKVKVAPKSNATIPALLSSADPMLVEKTYKKGKVVLCAVPLDSSWNSSFPRIWEYPVFIHELVYYLASASAQPKRMDDKLDRRESQLVALSESDRKTLEGIVPLAFENDPVQIGAVVLDPAHREELWWLLMVGVIVLLCAEIWLTRRMVRRREVV